MERFESSPHEDEKIESLKKRFFTIVDKMDSADQTSSSLYEPINRLIQDIEDELGMENIPKKFEERILKLEDMYADFMNGSETTSDESFE